ncbi:copper resistance CopC family protein [Pseudonocardia bannensis]|uniref:Copper resistance protein CopC n=1 Tax=Pseudonocardia bannensis TaxID=630973 RepID=A0A848DJT0_9PSEU|nr:copper resistance CopC family protein [Pseudonocardia bannensis]NMH92786.1 copper resistance protein CopC [Pseudonocardia bannensis]
MRAAVLSLAAAFAGTLLLLLAPPALAHTSLTGADPAPGAQVDRLERIRLEFAGRVAPDAPRAVALLAPDGSRWDDGAVTPDGERSLVAGVAPRLPAAGEYTVRWCLLGPDGHEQRGGYVFTYTGPVDPAAGPGAPAGDVSCAAQAPGDPARSPAGWLIGGAIAIALLGALIAGPLGRRLARRP